MTILQFSPVPVYFAVDGQNHQHDPPAEVWTFESLKVRNEFPTEF